MEKHPKNLESYAGSLEELAKEVGNLSYDQTTIFIREPADDLKKQADEDSEKGRKRLAIELYATAGLLGDAAKEMDSAWKICEPYMKNL